MKANFTPLLAIILVSFSFSSCLKNDKDLPVNPVSGVMAFNLATDRSAVDFVTANTTLTNIPVEYSNFTGAYLNVYSGSGPIDTYDHNTQLKLASANNNFGVDKYYSVFFVGRDSSYSNVVVEDHLDSLAYTSGKAYVRYINAIADSSSPVVKVSGGGADIFTAPAAFKTVSVFKAVNAGDVNIAVSNELSTINASRTITLSDSKVYTILLMGNAGNSTTPVEIKFIENGTLTP